MLILLRLKNSKNTFLDFFLDPVPIRRGGVSGVAHGACGGKPWISILATRAPHSGLCSQQCAVFSVLCAVCSVQCAVLSVLCALFRVVCTVKCALYSVYWSGCSV